MRNESNSLPFRFRYCVYILMQTTETCISRLFVSIRKKNENWTKRRGRRRRGGTASKGWLLLLRSCTVSKGRGSPRLYYDIARRRRRRRRKSYLCATAIPHSSLTSKHDRIDIILSPLSLSLTQTHTHKRIRKHQLKTANPPPLLLWWWQDKTLEWNWVVRVSHSAAYCCQRPCCCCCCCC